MSVPVWKSKASTHKICFISILLPSLEVATAKLIYLKTPLWCHFSVSFGFVYNNYKNKTENVYSQKSFIFRMAFRSIGKKKGFCVQVCVSMHSIPCPNNWWKFFFIKRQIILHNTSIPLKRNKTRIRNIKKAKKKLQKTKNVKDPIQWKSLFWHF